MVQGQHQRDRILPSGLPARELGLADSPVGQGPQGLLRRRQSTTH